MVVIGQMWLNSFKLVVFLLKWLYSGKIVVIGQSCSKRAKVVVFCRKKKYSRKWLYSGKSGCISGQSGSIRAEMVKFGQNGCIQEKVVVIWEKWLYSGKIVLFG